MCSGLFWLLCVYSPGENSHQLDLSIQLIANSQTTKISLLCHLEAIFTRVFGQNLRQLEMFVLQLLHCDRPSNFQRVAHLEMKPQMKYRSSKCCQTSCFAGSCLYYVQYSSLISKTQTCILLKHISGADPGEVKWVSFHPPPPPLF